jgi:23S rRNA pseudouridine1911/1915/1917 synthase
MTEPETLEFTVGSVGERLDKLVATHLPEHSRTQVQQLIADGLVLVDGDPTNKAGAKLRGGETVRVTLPEPQTTELAPQAMPLTFIYQDEHLAVLDKPAGLVVHPGVGNETGTLVNGLLSQFPHLMQTERKGIVHRLDKDTSGLIVVGLSDPVIVALMAQFQARTVEKFYLALTEKVPSTVTGMIDAPIGRDPKQRKRLAVVRDGKPAQTEFEVLADNFSGEQALLRCQIHTGRTHQIRVHLAFIGSPIVGDTVYGYRKQRVKLKRQFLHAAEIRFDHPITGARLQFEAPLPLPLKNLLDKLRKTSG